MLDRRVLAALACSLLFPMIAIAEDHAPPSASVVDALRRDHRAKDVWRVTTDSARYDVNVGTISALGLGAFTNRGEGRPPDHIGWNAIARIDALDSSKRTGQFAGQLLGGAAGLMLIGGGGGENSMLFASGLGLVGSVVGGSLGARSVRARELYVAAAPPATPATAAPSPTEAPPSPAMQEPATPREVSADSITISAACRHVSPSTLLRINGDFGLFTGYAATCSPQGLGGLRASPAAASGAPPEPLGWQHIALLETRGNRAGRGAAGGAMALGVTAGMLGFVVNSALGPEHATWGAPETAIVSALCGAAVGGLLGGSFGAMRTGWHEAYRHR